MGAGIESEMKIAPLDAAIGSITMPVDPKAGHESAIVMDAICPLLMDHRHLELYKRGAPAVASPVGGSETPIPRSARSAAGSRGSEAAGT